MSQHEGPQHVWFPYSLLFATTEEGPTLRKTSANPAVPAVRCVGFAENWTGDLAQPHGWWDILPFLLLEFKARRVERARVRTARHLLTGRVSSETGWFGGLFKRAAKF
ncbi:unnamed protein product [Effrenium voratum]|nr:unnamed protein product [Effrenium voratum]CAJ1449720.1 unnamed protein product [Effrenium voratum]